MKDKIKGFVKEHKKEIGLCTCISVVYLTGYMNGWYLSHALYQSRTRTHDVGRH